MKGNFNSIVNGNKPVLIDFHALWCGPCKSQTPIIAELAKEVGDKVRIIKIDIDKNQEIARRYSVRSVPTLMLFKNGNVVWQQAGLQTKTKLKQVIEQNT